MTSDPAGLVARQAACPPPSEFVDGLPGGELVLHYQPIVELTTGRRRGVETLVRWRHPMGGFLRPDDFLPALEQTALTGGLTRWVLSTACAASRAWPDCTLSVNVTARDVAGPTFADDVSDALDAAGMSPHRLILELTETALTQDREAAADTLRRLRELGVGVALEDFGTGRSSALYVRDLPITGIKIGPEFVRGMSTPGDDRAIVASVVKMAETIGLTVVAEGVESLRQAHVLLSLGCSLAQGQLWSPPVAPGDLQARYRAGSPVTPPVALPTMPPLEPQERCALALVARGASLRTIAAALNCAGHRTPGGGLWQPVSVARLINGG
jgi:EAL domain-containing protein (putative c-di-GMP-specific phosphodiesterase class I)